MVLGKFLLVCFALSTVTAAGASAATSTCSANDSSTAHPPPDPSASASGGTEARDEGRSDHPLVSAMYIFGDSTVDVGNRPYLEEELTNNNDDDACSTPPWYKKPLDAIFNHSATSMFGSAAAPPYGRDFDTRQPTGRYSNGRLVVDFLAADKLRFARFPPPLLAFTDNAGDQDAGSTAAAATMVHPGVNMASSESGVLPATGTHYGGRRRVLPLPDQVRLFLDTVVPAIRQAHLPGDTTAAAQAHLRDALFVISTGSDELLAMDSMAPVHLAPPTGLLHVFLHADFHPANYNRARMLPALWEQIERLYDAGARRFLLLEVGPLGCTPEYTSLSSCTGGGCLCHARLNELVEAHNRDVAAFLAPRFKYLAPAAAYLVAPTFDLLKAVVADPEEYGFKHTCAPCCGDPDESSGLGLAVVFRPCQDSDASAVCEDAGEFMWFDSFHPSHRANSILADKVWESVAEFLEAPLPPADADANTNCKCKCKPSVRDCAASQDE